MPEVGDDWVGKISQGSHKIQASIISPGDIMYSMVTIVNNTIFLYLKVAETVDLKSSLHKKKKFVTV